MKKFIQKNSNDSPFALFTKAALSKAQQGRLKGGTDGGDDGIIVEDVVEG